MKLRFLLRLRALFFFQILFFTATAQTHPITGTVLSKTTGQPLSGATITIKGTRSSTFTDNAGNFKIEVSEKARALTISYVGMTPQELAIPISGVLSILLVQATGSSLDEVVVVGYGTQRKSVVTGAISSVRSSDLESQPVIRVEQSLQGRTSGLTIASTSGQPGASSTVRLRGFTSFGNGKNDPLWVIDGVPYLFSHRSPRAGKINAPDR